MIGREGFIFGTGGLDFGFRGVIVGNIPNGLDFTDGSGHLGIVGLVFGKDFIIENESFLVGREGFIFGAGGVDLGFAFWGVGHFADGVDLFHGKHRGVIVEKGLLISGVKVGFLFFGKGIIASFCIFDEGFAFWGIGQRADGRDLIHLRISRFISY